MVFNDIIILSKKIVVGFFIYLAPLAIIWSGLRLITFLLTK